MPPRALLLSTLPLLLSLGLGVGPAPTLAKPIAPPQVDGQSLPAWLRQLPLNDALHTVQGKPLRHLVVFSDPNCPHCKRLEQELRQLRDVSIHTFLMPVLGEDSVRKSGAIWCSAQPQQAWEAWMLKGQAPMRAPAACDVGALQRNLALAQQLGVRGTPGLLSASPGKSPGLAMGARSALALDLMLMPAP
ncbi:DsbC family protein [Inhella inkyongensis]|nr:DsbC family protein [Inhella inkyongensis]